MQGLAGHQDCRCAVNTPSTAGGVRGEGTALNISKAHSGCRVLRSETQSINERLHRPQRLAVINVRNVCRVGVH